MGLTIHYRLSTRRRFDLVAVHDLIQKLHAQAHALRFAQVGEPYVVGLDYTWAFHWPRGAKKISDLLAPLEGWIFNATPGDGSESVAVGLCRYAGVNGWRLRGSCKTQYAARHGWEHFLACHRRVVNLLRACEREGLTVQVDDEGGYWKTRAAAVLNARLGEYDPKMAAFGGALKDAAESVGERVHGPIFSDPRFERLEAEAGTEFANQLEIRAPWSRPPAPGARSR